MPEKRILLIEDEATTREILTDLLRGEGYAVDSVATAGAATTCLDAIFYELVLTDWVLPDGNGTDIADTAAQLGSKTLIVTGHPTDLPVGVADRHELRSKQSGYPAIVPSGEQSAILNRNRDEAAARVAADRKRSGGELRWAWCNVAAVHPEAFQAA
jgi:CheY-like chemotaxis protein